MSDMLNSVARTGRGAAADLDREDYAQLARAYIRDIREAINEQNVDRATTLIWDCVDSCFADDKQFVESATKLKNDANRYKRARDAGKASDRERDRLLDQCTKFATDLEKATENQHGNRTLALHKAVPAHPQARPAS